MHANAVSVGSPVLIMGIIMGIMTQPDGSAYIVNLDGELRSNLHLPHETTFSHEVESIGESIRKLEGSLQSPERLTELHFVLPVYLDDTLLAVWRHGWHRRGKGFSETLEEISDHRKIYKMVKSDRYGTPSGLSWPRMTGLPL
ncbi:unnamed protein product [Menidia menidia]|uniref:(Atlantic silverside) hypothetical protein n=1 Tax=Menidia menidia TaxID=238744 RepID=A0A8S4BTL7_9TELE|nr:unnamed protein product [Menidia menidia]